MTPKACLLACLALALPASAARAGERGLEWESAIVTVDSHRLQYSYFQPWSRQEGGAQKAAVAISTRELLTTADWLQDSTLVRVQRDGRGPWWDARISWIDYHANLATLEVPDPSFWKGLKAAPLAQSIPVQGEVQIRRISEGLRQTWKGSVAKVFARRSQRSFVHVLAMEIVSEVNNSGWSEPVVKDGKLIGLLYAQSGSRALAIPATFIRFVLDARRGPAYPGLGYFDFDWESSKNPANARYLGLPGPTRGVIVTGVREGSAFAGALKPKDIVLEIDGFAVDSNGDYLDPDCGYLAFPNLETRGRLAGDPVRFKVWRDRRLVEQVVRLPKADYGAELVPAALFDRPPEYLIAAGLVFQPLTLPFLQGWGQKWWENAPFRLGYYTKEDPTPAQPHRVFLSAVLPDPFNLGYQDYAYLVVERINGRPVSGLEQAGQALRAPRGGFHVIEFVDSGGVRKLVLDAAELERTTDRVLRHFGIPKAASLSLP